jgi:hypothetical protein
MIVACEAEAILLFLIIDNLNDSSLNRVRQIPNALLYQAGVISRGIE